MEISKLEIEDIIQRLQNGETLPEDYKFKLFPVKQKEYELIYGGKMRREDLLANEDGVFPVPLQIEKTFNGKRKQWNDGWRNIMVFGDNLQLLKAIYENKDPLIKDRVKGKVKLIYIDPPFGTGDEYDGNKGQTAYSAKAKGAEFVEFLRRRLILAREILADDGTIFCRIDYHFGHYVKIIFDEVFGKDNFQNEIIINRFKRQLKNLSRFNHGTDSIFYYSKTQDFYFNEIERKRLNVFTGEDAEPMWRGMSSPGLRYPPEREIFGRTILPPQGRHWTFKQSKIEEMINENRIRVNSEISYTNIKGERVIGLPEYLQSETVPIDNNWTDIRGYVFGSSYPTENPEELLQRVIECSTDEGDIVFDFFVGSGTTAIVAEKLNRKWISCDIGKFSVYTTQKRLINISKSKSLEDGNRKYRGDVKSFILVNTGHYDLEKIFTLQQEEYSRFVMNLFEVEAKERTINGIRFDGERKDGFEVIVWEYWKFRDAMVDEEYLHDLHSYVGSKAGKRVYIIAPASYVSFISDYYEIDHVRYYFLKVPYQIIRELHKVQFKKFRQPQSKNNVNDLDDAVGFHFIRQPEVKSEFSVTDEGIEISLTRFISDFSEDESGKELQNFESLSMVMIDKDFNGTEFDMDECYFAAELMTRKKNEDEKEFDEKINNELRHAKTIKLPTINVGEYGQHIMLIYVDIYGNEFKEEFKVS